MKKISLKNLKSQLTSKHQKQTFNLLAEAFDQRNVVLSTQQQQYVLAGGFSFKNVWSLTALATATTPTAKKEWMTEIQQQLKQTRQSGRFRRTPPIQRQSRYHPLKILTGTAVAVVKAAASSVWLERRRIKCVASC